MSTCKLFIDVFIGLMELGELFLRNLYSLRIDHCDDSGNAFIPFNDSAPDLSAMHTRAFAVVGATTWNGLPVDLRHLPNRACLYSIPPPSKDCSFPLGLSRERL